MIKQEHTGCRIHDRACIKFLTGEGDCVGHCDVSDIKNCEHSIDHCLYFTDGNGNEHKDCSVCGKEIY